MGHPVTKWKVKVIYIYKEWEKMYVMRFTTNEMVKSVSQVDMTNCNKKVYIICSRNTFSTKSIKLNK
jgi:hypothetical protein